MQWKYNAMIYNIIACFKTLYTIFTSLIYIYIYVYIESLQASGTISAFQTGPPLWDDISTCPAAQGRHLDLSRRSRTTFRLILVLQDDISTYPVALGQHFDLSCCFRTTFRLVLLLRDDISTYPAAPGRHCDLSCFSGTSFSM